MNTFKSFTTAMFFSISLCVQANDTCVITNYFAHSDTTLVKNVYSNIQCVSVLNSFKNYALNNVRYPEHLVDYGLEGTVHVAIIIDEAGQIDNMQIVKSFSKYFNETVLAQLEGLKTLDILKKSNCGRQMMYLPVRFSLR